MSRSHVAKSVSRSLVGLRRSAAKPFSGDEDGETKTPTGEGGGGDDLDDDREYMEDYASELASARDAIDAIASGDDSEAAFEAAIEAASAGDGFSLEARSGRAETEAPELEVRPSTTRDAEEKEGGEEVARPGDEALLFVYGANPDLRSDVFKLPPDSTFRDVDGAHNELKEQIDLALGCPSQYPKEAAILFGMTAEHMAFLSPRSFVEIKRDAIARAYAMLLKEEEDARAKEEEVEKAQEEEEKAREEARKEFEIGVLGDEENAAEENAEEAPEAFPSPESFAETKRDVVARDYALSTQERSATKEEEARVRIPSLRRGRERRREGDARCHSGGSHGERRRAERGRRCVVVRR